MCTAALQFEAFTRGFMTLCGGPAIHLFSATELERLVCGNPLLDFAALQANARYEGGYGPDHRVRMRPHVPDMCPHVVARDCVWLHEIARMPARPGLRPGPAGQTRPGCDWGFSSQRGWSALAEAIPYVVRHAARLHWKACRATAALFSGGEGDAGA